MGFQHYISPRKTNPGTKYTPKAGSVWKFTGKMDSCIAKSDRGWEIAINVA